MTKPLKSRGRVRVRVGRVRAVYKRTFTLCFVNIPTMLYCAWCLSMFATYLHLRYHIGAKSSCICFHLPHLISFSLIFWYQPLATYYRFQLRQGKLSPESIKCTKSVSSLFTGKTSSLPTAHCAATRSCSHSLTYVSARPPPTADSVSMTSKGLPPTDESLTSGISAPTMERYWLNSYTYNRCHILAQCKKRVIHVCEVVVRILLYFLCRRWWLIFELASRFHIYY